MERTSVLPAHNFLFRAARRGQRFVSQDGEIGQVFVVQAVNPVKISLGYLYG